MDCTSRKMTELSSQLMYVDALHSLTQAIAALSVSCLLPLCPARAFLRLSRNSFCRIQSRDSYNQTLWWQIPTGCSTLSLLQTFPLTELGQSEWHKRWLFTLSPRAAATSNPAGAAAVGLTAPAHPRSSAQPFAAGEGRGNHSTQIQTSKEVESSAITLFGTYHLYELLTVK